MGSLCKEIDVFLAGLQGEEISFDDKPGLATLLEEGQRFKIKTYNREPRHRELFFLYKGLDHGHENFPELWDPTEIYEGKFYIDTKKKRILYCPFTKHDPYENDKGGEGFIYNGRFEEALNELINEGYQIVQITRLLGLEREASKEGKDHILRGANSAFYEKTKIGQRFAFQVEGNLTKQQILDREIHDITPITETTAEAYITRISVGW
jgi:hypothetical protein